MKKINPHTTITQTFIDKSILLSEEEMKEIESGTSHLVRGVYITYNFVKKVLNDSQCFEALLYFFHDYTPSFRLTFKKGGNIITKEYNDKMAIILGIDIYIKTAMLKLTVRERIHYEELLRSVSLSAFKKKYFDKCYDLAIDGVEYSIPIKTMIKFLKQEDKVFYRMCEEDDIYGLPKAHFAYAVNLFFIAYPIFQNYLLPDPIKKHYEEIHGMRAIDSEAVNQYCKTMETVYKKININPQLREAILSGLPFEVTALEKAIFIYIKMCRILTYDEEYYAVGQVGSRTKKHLSLDYISGITPQNNSAVCFEFTAIYARLLSELGINFYSLYEKGDESFYGYGHVYLNFRVDEFLLCADSISFILKGDLLAAKMNQPLEGLTIMNSNANTQRKFRETLYEVYRYIAKLDNPLLPIEKVGYIETAKDILEEYDFEGKDTLRGKIFILKEKVRRSGLKGLDALAYILQLERTLFTFQERMNYVISTIVRDGDLGTADKIDAGAIVVLNEASYNECPWENTYYFYNSQGEFVEMCHEEVQEKFESGTFAYVEEESPRIPGIYENNFGSI